MLNNLDNKKKIRPKSSSTSVASEYKINSVRSKIKLNEIKNARIK